MDTNDKHSLKKIHEPNIVYFWPSSNELPNILYNGSHRNNIKLRIIGLY